MTMMLKSEEINAGGRSIEGLIILHPLCYLDILYRFLLG